MLENCDSGFLIEIFNKMDLKIFERYIDSFLGREAFDQCRAMSKAGFLWQQDPNYGEPGNYF
jgi:hypothetical protein